MPTCWAPSSSPCTTTSAASPILKGTATWCSTTRGIRPLPRLARHRGRFRAHARSRYRHAVRLSALLQRGISAPHTSATDQGTDWRNNDPQVEPFVEIYQGDRQDYECPARHGPTPPSDSISGYDAAGYVTNALGNGLSSSDSRPPATTSPRTFPSPTSG